MLYTFGKLTVGTFLRLAGRPHILHRERLRQEGPVIYAANHFSMGDPLLLATFCPRPIWFLAREALFKKGWQRLLWKLLHVTPAADNGSSLGAVKKAIAFLSEGKAFGIYPEGHRAADKEEPDELERGCAFISLKSGAPVVPVYFDPMAWHTFRIWGAVGEPLYPERFAAVKGAVKSTDAMTRALTAAIRALREETNRAMEAKGL